MSILVLAVVLLTAAALAVRLHREIRTDGYGTRRHVGPVDPLGWQAHEPA